MNTKTQTELSGQLLGILHINQLDTITLATMPDLSLEPARRRADATHAVVGKAGRFHYAHWGFVSLLFAAGFLISGNYMPTAGNALAWSGAIAFASGLLLTCLSNPKHILRHLEVFDTFATSAERDWECQATVEGQNRVDGILNSLAAFPHQNLKNGAPVSAILEALRAAANQAAHVAIELERQLSLEFDSLRSGEEEWSDQAARARRSARTLAARLWTGAVRQATYRALDAREAMLFRKRQVIMLQSVSRTVLQPLIATLGQATQHFQSNVEASIAGMRDDAARAIETLSNRGSRDLFSKLVPEPAQIGSAAREAIQNRIGEVFGAVAGFSGDVLAGQIAKEEVQKILEGSAALPERLSDSLESLNGKLDNVLAQVDAESWPFAVAKPIPGREQKILRTVLVSDGPASRLFKEVQQRSEGSVCRALDHDREDELLVVTEERFQPGCECVELGEASKTLEIIPEHLRAAMVVAVDDDDLVLSGCHPEQRTDPGRGLKLLSLGLAFERILRRGNVYTLGGDREATATGNGAGNNSIAKGFEAAVIALQGDQHLADHVEAAINEFVNLRGRDGACKALDVALAKRELAPAANAKAVRSVLLEERRRLQRLA